MFPSKRVVYAVATLIVGLTVFANEAMARPRCRPRHQRHCRNYCYQPQPCCAPPAPPTSGTTNGGTAGTCKICDTKELADFGTYWIYEMSVCSNGTDAGTMDGPPSLPVGCQTAGAYCTTMPCGQGTTPPATRPLAAGNDPVSVHPDLCNNGLRDYPDRADPKDARVSHKENYYISFSYLGTTHGARAWKFNKKTAAGQVEFRTAHEVAQAAGPESATVIASFGYWLLVQVDAGQGHASEIFTVLLKHP